MSVISSVSSMNRPPQHKRPHPRDLSDEDLRVVAAENMQHVEAIYDEAFSISISKTLLPLLRTWFRPTLHNLDSRSQRKHADVPLIYASNHSGMAFPWDAMVFGCEMMAKNNFDLKQTFRPLAAPMISSSPLMNPYLIPDCWRRSGAVNATSLNFESLMQDGTYDVLIYPEGVPGIGKGFNKRYQLQKFSTSMIRMAMKYDTEIVSIFCINGEWINPHAYKVKWINNLVEKVGVSFLFIGILTIPLILFPFVFYAAFPAKLTYVKGKRYSPRVLANRSSWEDITEEDIRQVRDHIQGAMQSELDEAVEIHGSHPYRIGELFTSLWQNIRAFPYTTPLGWPALMTEFERQYAAGNANPSPIPKGWFRFLRLIGKNPIVIAYFTPILGWIPILWKGLRDRKKDVRAWRPRT